MSFLKSNIEYLLNKFDTNPNKLEKTHPEIEQSTLFRIQNGITKNPRYSTLAPFAKWAGVDVGDLFEKDLSSEDKFKSDNEKRFPPNISPGYAKLAPVLSWVQAGEFTNVQSVDLSLIDEWLPLPDECTNCFYLKVQGVSNSPTFIEGDYILVDPDVYYNDMQSGDIIVVRRFDDATFKKLVIEPDNSRYLQALNPDFKPNIIPLDENCIFIGEVVDSIRYMYQSKRRSKTRHS
ncbi:S24 family peptidase [Acinetobacter proteolyticus]|uniref:LexA family protein n=1 Tax=Acinetobacter proteolyticus TaxID=1776741 RepID=UPI0031D1A4EA